LRSLDLSDAIALSATVIARLFAALLYLEGVGVTARIAREPHTESLAID